MTRDSKIRVFLSYKREDYRIAQTLQQQIRNVTHDCSFFIDVDVIDAFDKWESKIDAELKKCDYFILIYTGKEKNYEYCMAEAGLFFAYHSANSGSSDIDGPNICCIYDTDAPPAFFRGFQNYSISSFPSLGRKAADVNADSNAEDQFYHEAPLFKFFKKFFSIPKDDPLRDDHNTTEFASTLALITKNVTNAFLLQQRGRIVYEGLLQDRITIRIPDSDFVNILDNFDKAVVDAGDQTLSVFNLRRTDGELTWGKIKNAFIKQGAEVVPWMIETENMIKSIVLEEPTSLIFDVTFRALNSDQVYRPALVRYVKYMNGSYDFYVTVLQSRPKKLAVSGISSSMLLVGLFFAARFRHEFFDKEIPLYQADGKAVDAECLNLRKRIENIENEAAEFGLNNKQKLIDAIGDEHTGTMEGFFNDWSISRAEIFSLIDSRLHHQKESPSNEQIRNGVRTAMERIRVSNKEFTCLMCKKLAEQYEC